MKGLRGLLSRRVLFRFVLFCPQ